GVELKQRQVEAVGRYDPDADEFLQQRPQSLVVIDQIVVELDALFARQAAQNHEERLIGLLRLSKAARQIVVNPEAGGFDFGFVAADLLFARRLLGRQRAADQNSHRRQNPGRSLHLDLVQPISSTNKFNQ